MKLLRASQTEYRFCTKLYEVLSGMTPGYDMRPSAIKTTDWKTETLTATDDLTKDDQFTSGIPSWESELTATEYATKIGDRYTKTNLYYSFDQNNDSIEFSFTLSGSAYDPMNLFRALQRSQSLREVQVEVLHANAHHSITKEVYLNRFSGTIVGKPSEKPAVSIETGNPSTAFVESYIDAQLSAYDGRGTVTQKQNGRIVHTRTGTRQQGLLEDTVKQLVDDGLAYVTSVDGTADADSWTVTVQLRKTPTTVSQ